MAELTTTLEDLLGDPQFLVPLGAGVLILLAFYVARRASGARPRGWALLYGAMVVAVLDLVFNLEASLVSRLALVAGAGVIVDLTGRLPARRWRLAAQWGAWSLVGICVVLFASHVTAGEELWVQYALPFWILTLGLATRSLDRSPLAEIVAPMLAVTVVGIWVTVPETDMVEAILGASLTMALVTLPPIHARATGPGLLLMACVIGWLTVDGGAGREVEVIGSLFCAGVVLLAPMVTLAGRILRPVPALVTHIAVVIIASRLVDWITSPAVVLAALTALMVGAVVALLASATLPGGDGDELSASAAP